MFMSSYFYIRNIFFYHLFNQFSFLPVQVHSLPVHFSRTVQSVAEWHSHFSWNYHKIIHVKESWPLFGTDNLNIILAFKWKKKWFIKIAFGGHLSLDLVRFTCRHWIAFFVKIE